MDRMEGIESPAAESGSSSSAPATSNTSTTTRSSSGGGEQRTASTNTPAVAASQAGGFSSGPINFQLGGFPAQATATFRVENGRVVPEAGSPAGPGAAAAPRPGGESGGSSGASSRAATPGSPGAGVRHPPPSLLAEVSRGNAYIEFGNYYVHF